MTNRRQPILFSAVVALLLTTSLASADDLVLVVNRSLGGLGSLTARQVKSIYLGKTTKLNGIKIKPFRLLDRNPVRERFIEEIMGMKSVKLKIYWLKETLKGGAHPPKAKKNSASLISEIKRVNGGMGYLYSDEASKSGLMIVKID